MKNYELKKNRREVSYKERFEIEKGCTLNQDDQVPEIIKEFEDKEEALRELKKYRTEIIKMGGGSGTYFIVTEYYIEENEYNSENEWINGGDVWEFSEIKIELVEKPEFNIIGMYGTMKEAENAYNEYEEKKEIYLAF